MEGTAIPGHVITSLISIFIEFLNRHRQDGVVCITIYLKYIIIDRETNRQISTGSNVGLVPWGHAKPGSGADDLPLILVRINKQVNCHLLRIVHFVNQFTFVTF